MARSSQRHTESQSRQTTQGRGWSAVAFKRALSTEKFTVGKVKLRDYQRIGRFPIVDQGQQLVAGYWDDERDAYKGPLPVVVFGDHTRAVKFLRDPFICGADGTKVLLPNRELFDAEFFFYALSNIELPNRGYNRHFPLLRATTLPCPPLEMQVRMAAVLRAVRQARETTDKMLLATRELKRSLLAHFFRYGAAPIAEADQVALQESAFGSIPVHWQVENLSNCASIQTGVAKGRRFAGARMIDVPYLRVANVQDGFLDLSEVKSIQIREEELDRFRLRPGDVLLTEGGDIDKLGRGHLWRGEIDPCVHQNHIFAVRPRRDRMSPEFFSYQVQSPYSKAYFLKVAHRTTNLASINRTKLAGLPVLLPPRSEQDQIVEQLGAIDRKIETEERQRLALIRTFDGVLRDLMQGKLIPLGGST